MQQWMLEQIVSIRIGRISSKDDERSMAEKLQSSHACAGAARRNMMQDAHHSSSALWFGVDGSLM